MSIRRGLYVFPADGGHNTIHTHSPSTATTVTISPASGLISRGWEKAKQPFGTWLGRSISLATKKKYSEQHTKGSTVTSHIHAGQTLCLRLTSPEGRLQKMAWFGLIDWGGLRSKTGCVTYMPSNTALELLASFSLLQKLPADDPTEFRNKRLGIYAVMSQAVVSDDTKPTDISNPSTQNHSQIDIILACGLGLTLSLHRHPWIYVCDVQVKSFCRREISPSRVQL